MRSRFYWIMVPIQIFLLPFFLALWITRSLECTKLLLQAGADPNGILCGSTPLGTAASEGETDFVKCLLEAGADPNTTDDNGLKPIEIAAQNGNHQEVEYLFPVTSRIPTCSDWSITGIMKYVHSEEAKKLVKLKGKEKHLKAKSKGEDAQTRKDYTEAIYYYNEMGLKPIELAAQNGYHRDVEYLFPVTLCIPTCSDWSITGLMEYVHSEQAKKLIKLKGKEVLLMAKSKGENALKRKGYLEALYHYNEALKLDPTDVTSLSKRSLCFACVGAAEEAWLDGKGCIKLRPEWPEAYYRGTTEVEVH